MRKYEIYKDSKEQPLTIIEAAAVKFSENYDHVYFFSTPDCSPDECIAYFNCYNIIGFKRLDD